MSGPQELRNSVAFTAGQAYERRRFGELLSQRISDLNRLGEIGLPSRTVRMLTAEMRLLQRVIDEAS
jgi:hypothetical protein